MFLNNTFVLNQELSFPAWDFVVKHLFRSSFYHPNPLFWSRVKHNLLSSNSEFNSASQFKAPTHKTSEFHMLSTLLSYIHLPILSSEKVRCRKHLSVCLLMSVLHLLDLPSRLVTSISLKLFPSCITSLLPLTFESIERYPDYTSWHRRPHHEQ